MKKIGGTWQSAGTGSSIRHRTFQSNDFAFSGMRASVEVFEEVGLFPNLLAAYGSSVDTMLDGQYKFGSAMYLGTGGDMDSGTIAASIMCYDPESFSLVHYPDTWERKGDIVYFVPAEKGTRQFKDENGMTDMKKAKEHFDRKWEQLRKGRNASQALDTEMQNQPRKPSHMFLTKTGNIFPRVELQEWLAKVRGNKKYLDAEFVGELRYDEGGVLKFHNLPQDRAIREFPHDPKHGDIRGALTMWEKPIRFGGEVPANLYIAGTDPYDHDESGTMSLGSTFIYKKIYTGGDTQEWPVAEYTGRHARGSDAHYEDIKKLLIYYNARNMHENNLIGMYKYFEKKNSAYLLMDVPEYAKEVVGSQPNRKKGMHLMNAQIIHGELLIKNWLEEEYEPGKLNLTKIRSVPLLQELIQYQRSTGKKKGNYDRVRAFMMTMYALQETFKIATEKPEKSVELDPFFARQAIFKERMKEKVKQELINKAQEQIVNN